MADVVVKAVVHLVHVSGLPLDTDQNTFVFRSATLNAAAIQAAAAPDLVDFYNAAVAPQVDPLATYISSVVDRGTSQCFIQWTDITAHLDGSAAGLPFGISQFTLGAPLNATVLPDQDCCVLSLFGAGRAAAPVLGPLVSTIPTDERAQDEGAPATHSGHTRPKQSHTGRIYLGPLIASASQLLGSDSRVSNGLVTDLAFAASELKADAASGSYDWVVWSRKLASVDTIVGGFVDNAWDIQRKRKVKPTSRVVWA